MTLVYLFAAWAAGIALTRALETPFPWWAWLLLGLAALVAHIATRPGDATPQNRHPLAFGLACLGSFALGGMALTLAMPDFGPGHLTHYHALGRLTVRGVIIEMPDPRDSHVNLRVRAEEVALPNGEVIPVEGVALVQAQIGPEYRYGERVEVWGLLRTPPEFDDFSYRDFLARQGVHSLMPFAFVELTGEQAGNPLFRALLDFRERANATITRLLPDPAASLLAGILLGIESGISAEVREAFNAGGATHVIAISGSNLVILAGLIRAAVGRFLVERAASLLTIAGIAVYTVFVGADAAVTRAAVMVTLVIVAGLINRRTFGPASLAFAGFAMTAVNPLVLWDAGFQLSFMATLGLVLYVEPLQNGLEQALRTFLSEERARQFIGVVSDAVLVTIAAQLTTFPVIAYQFGRLSVVSLPVNLLIVPAQPALMVLGGVGLLVALAVPIAGQVILWGSYLFLMWTVLVVRFFAALPVASVEVQVSALSVALFYALLFGVTALARQPDHTREALGRAFAVKATAVTGVTAAAVLVMAACAMPDGRLHVRFIDVGDGAATLITTPSGRHILVDAGEGGRRLSTALGDALPFYERRLDLVILTQPNADNIGGLLPVMRRYRVDAVMTNGVRRDTNTFETLWAEFDQRGTPIVAAEIGQRVQVDDGVIIEVLHAPTGPTPDGEAGDPLVLMLHYGEARILLTGDLTPQAEGRLMRNMLLDATVLQVPRSGHESVSGAAFLEAVSPQMSVISVGVGNRFGLPHAETLTRLDEHGGDLYRTDIHGTIHVWTDGADLWVRPARR